MHTLDHLDSGALTGAREVRLCNQGLTDFPPALYALADTLELLDLSGNQLTTLPADFTRFAKLRVLFASNNPFTQLPPVLGQLPQLEMVGFKACQIDDVPAASLPARLRWLILTDNRLTHLPDTLGERPRLQKLMLSCNQLSALPATLARCTRLELLRLASNRFTAVPDVVFQLPHLVWLALAGNPLTQESEQAALAPSAQTAISYADLEVQELLGEGASGHIYRAVRRSNGAAIALKVFKAAHTSDGTPQSELPAGMQPLAGPPSLRSCTRDVYAPGLHLSPGTAQHLLAQIHSAVHQLHSRGVLHGDLYAHNILWNPGSGAAVLSDLGAALLTARLPAAQVQALQHIERRALHILRDELYAIAR